MPPRRTAKPQELAKTYVPLPPPNIALDPEELSFPIPEMPAPAQATGWSVMQGMATNSEVLPAPTAQGLHYPIVVPFPGGQNITALGLLAGDIRLPLVGEYVKVILSHDEETADYLIPVGTHLYRVMTSVGIARWIPNAGSWIFLVECGKHHHWICQEGPPAPDGFFTWTVFNDLAAPVGSA